MANKFLDYAGLEKLWAKIKELVDAKLKNSVSDKAGVADGLATLDSTGKLTETQLPDTVATLTDGILTETQLPTLKTINNESILGEGNITINLDLFKIVTALPLISDVADEDKNKVFLIPNAAATVAGPTEEGAEEDGGDSVNNVYDEYIIVNKDTDPAWELIGQFIPKVDLSDYVTKSDVVSETANGLMSKEDKAKLDGIVALTTDELEALLADAPLEEPGNDEQGPGDE